VPLASHAERRTLCPLSFSALIARPSKHQRISCEAKSAFMQLPRKEFVVCNAYIHLVQTRHVPDVGRVSRSRAKARRAARQNRHSKCTKAQLSTEAPFDVSLANYASVELARKRNVITNLKQTLPGTGFGTITPLARNVRIQRARDPNAEPARRVETPDVQEGIVRKRYKHY
jgi:hypothetical protein